jgi:hypothetical protein
MRQAIVTIGVGNHVMVVRGKAELRRTADYDTLVDVALDEDSSRACGIANGVRSITASMSSCVVQWLEERRSRDDEPISLKKG